MSSSTLTGRCTRAFAAVAVVSTLVTGPFASVASAEPVAAVAQQAPVSTVEEKTAALREIGWQLTPEVAQLADQDFVIHVWSKADALREAFVRDAAARAFREQGTNPAACYEFIVRGVFTAHRQDVEESLRKAVRDRQRVAAAAVVGWTAVAQADLDSSLKEFVFRIWERSRVNSQVRAKAEAVLTPAATDVQRQGYIEAEIFVAQEADRQNPPR